MSGRRPASRPLRVALLGAGTVGREVARGFLERPERLIVDDGAPLELAAICVRDLDRARAGGLPPGLLTDAPAHLVASPDVDVIVELMGGDEPARTLISAALSAGKSVVTANKHVVAHHGPVLEATARKSRAALRFEAAVGGGIPVLGPIARELAANRVTRLRGIVNGTTNYILSAMATDGRAYDAVLAEAQARGYAEADPTADVAGDDAANKLVILARLAFGAWLDPGTIVRRPQSRSGAACGPGITSIGVETVAVAAAFGLVLKLVADARLGADGGISASVLPTAVPTADPLSRIGGVMNRIEVKSEPLGSVAFTGPGAGGAATASAVLADLRSVARGEGSTWAGLPPASASSRQPALIDEASDRGWLAVVPVDSLNQDGGADRLRIEQAGDWAGIHVHRGSFAAFHALLADRVRPDVDVPVYPVDEPKAGHG